MIPKLYITDILKEADVMDQTGNNPSMFSDTRQPLQQQLNQVPAPMINQLQQPNQMPMLPNPLSMNSNISLKPQKFTPVI